MSEKQFELTWDVFYDLSKVGLMTRRSHCVVALGGSWPFCLVLNPRKLLPNK